MGKKKETTMETKMKEFIYIYGMSCFFIYGFFRKDEKLPYE